ncbi:hypothetical protein NE237_017352 [Protea cynaroides]|uniref:Uncharacterized protein n=1 Tax=Protea cynaroides TaxID=273540 RepID=A0A9Q0QMW8_9MAGN|nr:hypothetical protein NE237_017352 [Protea cynaroides]
MIAWYRTGASSSSYTTWKGQWPTKLVNVVYVLMVELLSLLPSSKSSSLNSLGMLNNSNSLNEFLVSFESLLSSRRLWLWPTGPLHSWLAVPHSLTVSTAVYPRHLYPLSLSVPVITGHRQTTIDIRTSSSVFSTYQLTRQPKTLVRTLSAQHLLQPKEGAPTHISARFRNCNYRFCKLLRSGFGGNLEFDLKVEKEVGRQ